MDDPSCRCNYNNDGLRIIEGCSQLRIVVVFGGLVFSILYNRGYPRPEDAGHCAEPRQGAGCAGQILRSDVGDVVGDARPDVPGGDAGQAFGRHADGEAGGDCGGVRPGGFELVVVRPGAALQQRIDLGLAHLGVAARRSVVVRIVPVQ